MESAYHSLEQQLDGDLHDDELTRRLYATDASVYRKLPLAVVLPRTNKDLIYLVNYANTNNVGLIPRTAGTSLAGQCVGDGIVVDFSKYFNRILSFNELERTVTVQPGVVRDELNNFLKPFGLFFGPNTSTSNRCMIGGMVGNNSSGTTSIKYGVTRDKIISLKTILSDGSEVIMNEKSKEEIEDLRKGNSKYSQIYYSITEVLGSEEVRNRIIKEFPKPEIHRRNNGYAIDKVIYADYFMNSGNPLNLSHLICGSEGTLAFITEITLKLDPLPPENDVIVALHFNSIQEALDTVASVMTHDLYSCELLDDTILNLTKHNKTQQGNRQFINGEPKALLLCELRSNTQENLDEQVNDLIASIQNVNTSYAQVILKGTDIVKAMELRKAGLGLLGNMIGDKKAVACIEDTAVALEDLASYISDFTNLMASHKQKAVYYAHAGAGELHLRPILNLKSKEDVKLFRKLTTDVANLVKKYGGAMSGEHGDGIVRSEFIPLMIGQPNYEILKQIKQVFDPNNIFNPGKIVDPKPMDRDLRYEADRSEPEIETLLDFNDSQGILREAEKCNGSGDCRKLPEFGGTMCPSYRATRNEKDTTRARANALREYLTNSNKPNKFDHEELKSVFDLCLSCKACSSECPSSVDVAALKAEFQYQYQKTNGVPIRTKLLARNNAVNKLLSPISGLVNWSFKNAITSKIINKAMGIAEKRSLPKISSSSLFNYYKSIKPQHVSTNYIKAVYLFVDEFTNYLDTKIGKDTLYVLEKLKYKAIILNNKESGRALISKGLLEEAKEVANKNIALYKTCISEKTPLVGIEPSAILSFKDEYLRLGDDQHSAKQIASHTYLIEEFLQKEIQLGNISQDQFTDAKATIKYHGHCHQKALSNQKSSFDVLNLPRNYKVTIIPSGCCGMAGSFGYEKENYDISMSIGGQTLFPAINKSHEDVIIAANGTSCRHQILDGTGRYAKHPISILREALL